MMNMTRALALMGTVVLLLASGATIAAEPSSTPTLDWLFDAPVNATAHIGNTLFVGGAFTSAAPSSGVLSQFFQLSPSTGAPVPGLPAVNGAVTDITSDSAGGYYIAGYFTNIGPTSFAIPGVPRGTYVLRVRAVTSAGSGAPSSDVVAVVP